MSLTMEQLYIEYEHSIAVQTDVIEKNRAKLNTAIKRHDYKSVQRLNKLLRVLYDEKWELEEKSRQLKEYLRITA